ncbi:MAG: DNA polymerase IV [bacterium]|nr:DNA polymerase IV [bacterium]
MTWHPPETDIHRPVNRVNQKKRKELENGSVQKRIMHIDMDAFFASVEQRDNPMMRGKPVIVGGRKGERGVVSTCSYEARKFGVKSGMSMYEADRLCPHGIYIRGNGSKYVHASVKVFEIFKEYTPIVEPVSIDEAYLDITGCMNIYGSERIMGEKIKKEVVNRLGLTCTVGIAHNRIFAKLASGFQKPDGLTIFTKNDIKPRIYPLPVRRLYGIGEKTEEKLNKLKIFTIGDLAERSPKELKKYLGIHGEHLVNKARGKSAAEVISAESRPDEKSVGHENTFIKDVLDPDTIDRMYLKLSQKVGRRLRKKGFMGKIVTIKLRYSDFETHTHRETYPDLIKNDIEIYRAAQYLFNEVYQKGRPIRLIGVSVSGLVRDKNEEGDLFQQSDLFKNVRKNEVNSVLDDLRNKYGEKVISRITDYK